jgi:hypothetical protein
MAYLPYTDGSNGNGRTGALADGAWEAEVTARAAEAELLAMLDLEEAEAGAAGRSSGNGRGSAKGKAKGKAKGEGDHPCV